MGAIKAVNDDAMKLQCQKRLADAISEDGGMANVDGSDFPKKGNKSVGVSRQHCGTLGKIENCQAGVFVGYSSDIGYGLVDYRLYMPKSWMGDENKERRDECHVPEDLEFKTKVELASEMISNMIETGLFKVKWVGADSNFGRNKEFLKTLPEGTLYFADILFNMKVFPLTGPAGSGIAAEDSVKVCDVATDESIGWERTILAEGSKGPIIAEDKCVRVHDNDSNGKTKGKPGAELWLYIRKYPDGKLKYALSNAPYETPMSELRRAGTMRWPIEQCFEECKDELGMDHYETRSWVTWHRHMLFVLIAHLFLLEVRLGSKKNCNFDVATSEATRFGGNRQ
jgi:SRSO17 transposase